LTPSPAHAHTLPRALCTHTCLRAPPRAALNMMGCVVYHDDACYRFDQKLSNALMGHVYTVEMFVRNAAGTYVHPVNPHKVVKVLYREFVDARRALDGRGVQEDPMHELAVLSYFQLNPHPNITGLLDYMEDEHRLYIVMEYLDGGELFNQIASNRPFAESDLRSWMWQALNGAHHMHCHGLGHLDLSLENLALCSLPEPDTVKLLDFGVCMPLPEEGAAIRPPHAGMCRAGARVCTRANALSCALLRTHARARSSSTPRPLLSHALQLASRATCRPRCWDGARWIRAR
ncbi:hypothetical protein EON67_03315, partial [archaeon]